MNVFDRALEVIHERGMCKGMLEDEDGHVCLNGALNYALTGNSRQWGNMRYYGFVKDVAQGLFPERGCVGQTSPAPHNNHPDTTQEDVELILKHSAYEWDMLHA